jgi:hypothetical protein
VQSAGLSRSCGRWRALEAGCCAFLSITVSTHDDIVELEIAGPPDARPLIDSLFAAS